MKREDKIKLKLECTGHSKDETHKNYIVTVNSQSKQGNAEHTLTKSMLELEEFMNNIKKLDANILTGVKYPKKSLFKSSADILKQRGIYFNEIFQKCLKNDDLINEEIFKSFFQLKFDTPSTKEESTSVKDEEEDILLGETYNKKAQPSDFEFIKVIGKGSFGQVYLAKHVEDNHYYAVKVLLKKHVIKRNETRHIMAEKNILAKNNKAPFLVNLHYSFQTKNKLYFVLTYVNGGELFYHLQREKCFTENRVRFYSAELSIALGHLHNMNIIYRDLKPENILLDKDGHVMLTDFGLCKENIDLMDKATTFCGTPEYLAPEILLKKSYDKSVDWWCLGCVIYELLFGLPPFYNKDTSIMYNAIVNQEITVRSNVSDSTKLIIEQLLEKNYKQRLGYSEKDVEEIKAHPFYNLLDWDLLIKKKIIAPFKPYVSGEGDTRNIDVEFTREAIPNSLIPHGNEETHVGGDNEAFDGFTFIPTQE